ENGEVHQADHIVIATDATTATQFLPGSPECEPRGGAPPPPPHALRRS
ncbi:MAG: hypothetical protein ACI8QC_004202, partial [Planctomycetota bacterium]